MRNILLVVIMAMCSCNAPKEDKKFKHIFLQNISLVEQLYNYEDSLHKLGLDTILSYRYDSSFYTGVTSAISYNEVVTGISPSYNLEGGLYFFDTPGNNLKVKSTINAWKAWYEENKFIMTIQKADSLFYEEVIAYDIVFKIMANEGNIYIESPRYNFLVDSVKRQFRDNYPLL